MKLNEVKFCMPILLVYFSIISAGVSADTGPKTKKKLFNHDQPITLKSKTILVNQKNGNISYKGNVRVKQGDLLIIAAKANTKTVGGQPNRIWASGHPVKVQSRKDGSLVTITASNVQYNVKSGIILLTGNVQLHIGKDTLRSKKISYNVKTNTVTVNTKNAPLNASFDSDHLKAMRK